MGSKNDFRDEKLEELRREGATMEETFRTDKDPTIYLESLKERMQDVMSNNFGTEIHQTFFLEQMLPKYILILLKRSDISEESSHSLNIFFQSVLELIIHFIPKDIHSLSETLHRLLNSTAPFYLKFGSEEITEEIDEDIEIYSSPSKQREYVLTKASSILNSKFLLDNINHFAQEGGFKRILERIKHRSPRIPLPILKFYLKVISKNKDVLSPKIFLPYFEEIYNQVFNYILGLSDEELKNEDRRTITEISFCIYEIIKLIYPDKANEIVDNFNLEIALKCLKSPYLEKRLTGLNDIKEFIASVTRKEEWLRRQTDYKSNENNNQMIEENQLFALRSFNSKSLIEWIKNQRILEQLYGENVHTELIKRSSDIPKFLAVVRELDRKYLDLIWNASLGKHESITHIIFSTLSDLGFKLPLSDIEYVFEKIRKIPYSDYDLHILYLVRQMTVSAINLNLNEKKKKWYGLEIFWDLIQEETNATSDVIFQAQTNLYEFLQWELCHPQRVTFMEKCINNLNQHKSVSSSLRTLQRIISTYPKKSKNSDSVSSVINWLNSTHKLLDIVFKDLAHYKMEAKSRASQILSNETDLNSAILVGKIPHFVQIKDRLDFLEYVLPNSQLMLSLEQLDNFWSSMILNAVTHEERDSAFAWIENARGLSFAHSPFSDEATQYLFLKKIPQLDFSSLSVQGFSLFEFFFRYVNWKAEKFTQDESDYRVLSFDLIGMNTLLEISLQATDPVVGQQAISFINNLQKNLSVELKPFLGVQREQYIQICMNHLAQASKDLNTENELRINRCLALLRTLLEEFEIKIGVGKKKESGQPISIQVNIVHGPSFQLEASTTDVLADLRQKISEKLNQPINTLRLISAGRELKDDTETVRQMKLGNQPLFVAKRPQASILEQQSKPSAINQTDIDESILPSRILSKQEYFNQLFELLNSEKIAQKVWDLIMLLPTNNKIFHEIYTLQKDNQSTPNWNHLLGTNSTFKLFYSLQIVESLLYSSEDDSEEKRASRTAWKNKFLSFNGPGHLFHILLNHQFYDKTKGSKRKFCLVALLRIINFLLIEHSQGGSDGKTLPRINQDLLLKSVNSKTLVEKLLELSWYAAVPESCENLKPFMLTQFSIQPEIEDSLVVKHIINLLVALCLSDDNIFNFMTLLPYFEQWLSTLLIYTLHHDIRDEVSSGLLCICQNTLNFQIPHLYFLNKLLSFLPKIDPFLSTSGEYFQVLNSLIKNSCNGIAGGNPLQFESLLDELVEAIRNHPIVEDRSLRREDVVLEGLMSLTLTLISKEISFKEKIGPLSRGGLIEHLFHNCLFDIATMDNHGLYCPPKCKTKRCRNIAFSLLSELAKGCLENFQELSELLLRQHPINSHRTNWHYLPHAHEKSPSGYVGLRNLGATCYMNSLIQQLYMIPEFRYGLFSVPIKEEMEAPLKENILYQLQVMLSNLQESEKKYYDTQDFCRAYKYEGQPINPSVQMDADEFFNMLFDKLENITKGTQQENILKKFFGGTLCNQIISKECEHISERMENYYSLSLDVKNKKNILESLDLYIQGDMLEGENKYMCSVCNKKVDALKRVCISSLPDNLIIHAKRFEFDLEQMKRIKVNDYCEFPETLDMEPYTKEGLEKKEMKNANLRPSSYYQYQLTGILVHTGTAEAGHYYSFIRERVPKSVDQEPRWYQFNDSEVEPFDIKEIPKACYGGLETVAVWDPVQQKHVPRFSSKFYSAYMLFYERVESINSPKPKVSTAEEESSKVPREIFTNIWNQNMNFLNDKNIFDPDYFRFIWNIISIEKDNPSPPIMDYSLSPESCNDPRMICIQLGTCFLINTLSHAKERAYLASYCEYVKTLFSNHIPACKWFIQTLLESSNQWSKQILFLCTVSETRETLASLIIHVLKSLTPYEKDIYQNEKMEIEDAEKEKKIEENPFNFNNFEKSQSLCISLIDKLLGMLKEAHSHWHHYAQYFLIFREFAKIGTEEKQYLISRSLVGYLLDFYLGEESPYANVSHKQKKPKMGDKFSSPNLSYMIDCVSILTQSCSTESIDPPPSQLPGKVLNLNRVDQELLHCEAFYNKVLRDNIHPKGVAEIVLHLSWQNQSFSKMIIDVCMNGINAVDHDRFKPYQEVLTPLFQLHDSLQHFRIDYSLSTYLSVIQSNIKYRNATLYSIKYLLDILPSNPLIREWLFTHKEWIEPWLMQNASEYIRSIACSLVQSLVPEYPTMSLEGPQIVPKNLILSEETLARAHSIYLHLLALLPSARHCWRFEIEPGKNSADYDVGHWKLVFYFRLLKWYARGTKEKNMFGKYFKEFSVLFYQADNFRLVCDENKKELINFWHHVTQDNTQNTNLLINDEKLFHRLLDFWISLNPNPRYKQYNSSSLPPFYSLILLTCKENSKCLEKIVFHHNFEWAIRYLYLETTEYEETAKIIFEILTMCCTYPAFRQKHIMQILAGEKNTPKFNIHTLRFLQILLKTPEDQILFCKHQGLQQLVIFIEMRQDRTESELLVQIDLCLDIMAKAISWMMVDNIQEPATIQLIFQQWPPSLKMALRSMSTSFAQNYSKDENILKNCFELMSFLCTYDETSLKPVLRYIIQAFHTPIKEQKPFFLFGQKICQIILQKKDPNIDTAIDIILSFAKENLDDKNFEILQKIWNSEDVIKESLLLNKKFPQLLIKIVSSEGISEAAYEFFKSSFLQSKLAEETKQNLVQLLATKFDTAVQQSENSEPTISNLIQILSTLSLLTSGESRTKFIEENQDKLKNISNKLKETAKSSKTEILENLLEKEFKRE